jgi:hypothetical protein
MKTLEIVDATDSLGEYAKNLGHKSMLLTKDGRPIAALISVENFDAETVCLSMNPKFIALIERSRSSYRADGGISAEELRRQLSPKSTARKPTIARTKK